MKQGLNNIKPKSGDILQADTEAIVNTVNCVGVMGRGLARQFKQAFSHTDFFQAYKEACNSGELCPGRVHVFKLDQLTMPRFVINFPTKRHWRHSSRFDDVEAGLEHLKCVIQDLNIHSIAIPALGCGLGGLYWEDVRLLLEETLGELHEVDVFLYVRTPKPEQLKQYSIVTHLEPL